ncbi:Peptidoglycan/LPS O-acetylase OafA/YrhL, contains acyltransferase and SGNH-hydrolase domains [Halopseudomonas sabulinigri]|uniref:Peptidoglycan/LPS O-acetylase OafA/YrhL, contains acyltransferase and SGNH-hydrolase domains n=1 Tax=Halopseudomonas sabulinigri TaxID=472181 RepID=A0A1H1L8D0_9GAMM|nr:acyltransferase family protein [Halopseudomonas sabulinigri]SDR70600.1 Peptidoglycan/LPS O-acetylase OafA/YrhL, contains acyltransferase and SGNH-hydrolase domains [Halopseudomonas sabulinigri]
MSSTIKYRPEIDGLRALAVVPVVLFHSGVEAFSGGFSGVNIFFVISGYLITSIISREIESNTFKISTFYQKRADRLFPVLASVLLATLIIGFFTSPPDEYQEIAKSVIAAGTFTSNIFFWSTSDYFSASAFTIPLLHTWSLGIEEQFYIFFPFVLIIAFRLKLPIALVAIAAAVSFTLSSLALQNYSSATFYLLPTRAWELLIGALLALIRLPIPSRRIASEVLSWTGLSMCLWCIFFFNKETAFPGPNALFPVLGAALLIYSTAHPQNSIRKAFNFAPVTTLGKASYSIYMWHWPFIVFYGLVFGYPSNLVQSILIAAISICIGLFSWATIEKWSRGKIARLRPIPASACVVSIFLPVIALSSSTLLTNGLPFRVESNVIAAEAALEDYSPYRASCHSGEGNRLEYSKSCILGHSNSPSSVAVWGDSHGVEIAAALAEQLAPEKQSVRQLTYSSCPPAINLAKASRPGCRSHNEATLQAIIADPQIQTVILSAYFPVNQKISSDFLDGFKASVEHLESAGKNVIVMYPLPQTTDNAPTMIARSIMLSQKRATSMTLEAFMNKYSESFDLVSGLPSSVTKIESWKNFCINDDCYVGDEGGAYFFDGHHPSMHGARLIARDIANAISLQSDHAVATSTPSI